MESFAALGDYKAALALVRTMASAYHDGPGGQAHQVFTKAGETLRPVAKAAADQQWFELAGAVTANRIVSGLFGVEPPLEFEAPASAASFLRDPTTPRGFNGVLSGVRIREKLYTVESGSNGSLSWPGRAGCVRQSPTTNLPPLLLT